MQSSGMGLAYDYCGAPWKDGKVGNGGFSIRNTKLSKEQSIKYGPQTANEDKVFVKWCEDDSETSDSHFQKKQCQETIPGRFTIILDTGYVN